MVWNDWFDRAVDARERPSRPLPSGRVAPRTAVRLGSGLLAAGVAFAGLAGLTAEGWSAVPLLLSVAVAAAVLLYDGWLKRTAAGPVGMGLCRFLNVLLGLSLGGEDTPWPLRLHLAAVVGIYIVGVTWFARKEAETSRAAALRGAAAVMLCALALTLPLPLQRPPGSASVSWSAGRCCGRSGGLGRPRCRRR
jgi:4-hydroxybenzoate polyprenyltransferase